MDLTSKAAPLLQSLVGQRVTIYTSGGAQDSSDTGMLDSYDADFVRLRTDKGTYFYFGIARIRLIKPA
ncbi:MAG TPA: hypothetical protein VGM51_00660 [Armatimonadota bacterium]|jgi:hypothetical protein